MHYPGRLPGWLALGVWGILSSWVYSQDPVLDGSSKLIRRLDATEQQMDELKSTRRLPESTLFQPVSWADAVQQEDAKEGEAEEKLADRVKKLEKALEDQDKADKKAKDDAKKKPSLTVAGRLHIDYWTFPGEDDGANFFEYGDATRDIQDRFQFRRARIQIGGDMFDTMAYRLEVDFANPNSPVFKDAYITWKELPLLETLQLGNQKRPYGLDAMNSSRYNVFMERALIVDAFNQDQRRFGLCSYGVSEDEAYNWRLGSFLATDIQNTGEYLATDNPGLHHYQAEIAGRLANTIWYDETSEGRGYAHIGISGTVAAPDGTAGANNVARFRTRPEARTTNRWIDTGTMADADSYELVGLEGVLNVGAMQLVGEYMLGWVQRDPVAEDLQFNGGYTYLSYFLTGEHIPWERATGTIGRVKPFENFFLVETCDGCRGNGMGAWEIAARYSYADLNDADIFGGIGNSFTLAVNWHWTPYSKLMFNYIVGDIDNRALAIPNANYNFIGARFAVDF